MWVETIPKLQLLPGPLWPGVLVPVWVSSLGQIELLKNNLYSIGPCAIKAKISNKKQLQKKNVGLKLHRIWYNRIRYNEVT